MRSRYASLQPCSVTVERESAALLQQSIPSFDPRKCTYDNRLMRAK
jgi:hypothetical protein